MFDDTRPIFLQLAAHMRINPATAGKALNLLVDEEILHKKRGIGMFVSEGARQKIAHERQRGLAERFVRPLLAEAKVLGLSPADIIRLIEKEAEQ